jgi:hypothetical protein
VTLSPRKWLAALVAAVRTLGGLSAIARPELFTLSPLAGLGRRPRRPLAGDGGWR